MSKPNVLIFMTDHQRGDTVLPGHPAQTPVVDRLAEQGVSFSRAYCPSPHCCPSRATFHSGLYPSQHGVWNNVCNRQALSRGLNPGVRLWSEDLADAGYDLHFCGKWHVSVEELPSDRGWTDHAVSGAAGTHHGVEWDHYRRLAQTVRHDPRGEGEILRPGYGDYVLYGASGETSTSHDELVIDEALGVLADSARATAPWGLFVGLVGPHDPYKVPQRYLDLYDLDGVPLPPSYSDDLTDKPQVYQRMRRMVFGQLSEREVREGIRHFWAYCTYLDEMLGRVMRSLEQTGQANDTLVLFCSDHGDYCGDHGLFCKGIPCFSGAYDVPAVVRWPAGIRRPGRCVDAFVSLADFAPTFVEAAGLSVDRPFSGASLGAFLRDESPADWRTERHTQCNGVELYYTQRSVATDTLKYVYNGFDQDELYDLVEDPHEMVNRAGDPAYAAAKRDMVGRMWRFACSVDDTAINPYVTVGLAPYGPAEAFR